MLKKLYGASKCKKIILLVVLILIFMYVLFNMLFMIVDVKSNSMESTIYSGYKLLATKIVNGINRGDVVVFNSHEDNKVMIKRVIGLPNETVKIENGIVYIDGSDLQEGYLTANVETDGTLELKIPENCYFLLGDNRSSSNDSRYWSIKTVKRRDIVSKVLLILYPFNKISLI